MRKPNFLIVGAAKSGTTSLFQYLRGHPEVFMPDLKEASYFAGAGIRTEAEYLGLFQRADTERAVGEASGAYLYLPTTAAAIRDLLGRNVRIVVILRNPIDMAYSLWGHMVREGGEDLAFFDALRAEEGRMADPEFHRQAKGWSYNFAYVSRARYAAQVARYLSTFEPNRVRVLVFEEFFADVSTGFSELCRFLEVGSDYRPIFHAFNRSGVVRSAFLRRILDEPTPWKDVVKAITPDVPRLKVKAWLREINHQDRGLPPLSPAERERLWRLFAPDVAELAKLLGRPLDCWSAQPTRLSAAAHAAAQGHPERDAHGR